MKKMMEKIMLIFIISLLIYINFITGYFSVDSEKIVSLGYKEYATQYSLNDGRIFMYLILMIANLFNISLQSLYIILSVMSLLISSCSVLILYNTINDLKKEDNKLYKIITFLLTYSYIFNFMTINNMEFIECIIMSISVLMFIIAAKKIVLQNKLIIGFIICLLGILFYQGTINVFITTSIMFLTLNKTVKQEKYYFVKKTVLIAIVTISVVLLDVIIVKILQVFVESTLPNRLNFNIVNNIKGVIKNIPMLVCYSIYIFPKFLQLIIITILTTLMYIYSIRNKKIKEFWTCIFLIIICYVSCLIIGIVQTNLICESNGRMFFSAGALISVVMIYMYVNTDIFNKEFGIILKSVLIIYFIINILNTVYITNILKMDNEKEKRLSFEIKKQLGQNNINKIAIDYVIGEEKRGISRNKIVLCLYGTRTYKFYTGENVNKVYFDEYIKREYFADRKEKMMVINGVLYIMLETDNYNYI